jgi:putative transcriptional regulator
MENRIDPYNGRKFIENMIDGLQDAVAFSKGDASKARVRLVTLPEPIKIPSYGAEDIYGIRKRLKLSKYALACVIGVSSRTVEAWEDGRTRPNGVVSRIIYLVDNNPELIDQLVIQTPSKILN